MNLTPAKKVIIIFLITFIALIIALPKRIPVRINIGALRIDQTFTRRDLNFSLGEFNIQRDFELALGLDLAGGSHMVFEIDTSGIDSTQKSEAIKSLREVIARRVNLFGVSEPNIQTSSFNSK